MSTYRGGIRTADPPWEGTAKTREAMGRQGAEKAVSKQACPFSSPAWDGAVSLSQEWATIDQAGGES